MCSAQIFQQPQHALWGLFGRGFQCRSDALLPRAQGLKRLQSAASRDCFDAPNSGADARLGNNHKGSDIACAGDVRPATQLLAEGRFRFPHA